jgi:hypothetical protein
VTDLPKTCTVCGTSYWSWSAHAERCYGRPALSERADSLRNAGDGSSGDSVNARSESVEPLCDCKPGWQHERGCPNAYWPEDAA